jgi:predicted GNAT family N-acyltransferase
MESPPLDSPIFDVAPADRHLTGYDQQHLVTYLRMLDEGADVRSPLSSH